MKLPSKQTLRKYGLTAEAWLEMAIATAGACALCGRVPLTGRLVVDHEHVRSYKKLSDEDRARCVRGLCCWSCNHLFIGRNTLATARLVVKYLEKYEARRPRDLKAKKKSKRAA